MPVPTSEQRGVNTTLLGASTFQTLLGVGALILGIIIVIILSLLSGALDSFASSWSDDYELVMSPECDDLNDCTWDFMRGVGSHCENVNVKNGLNCSDACLIEGTGSCQLNSKANPVSCCVGECAGVCGNSSDCPDLMLKSALVGTVPVAGTCFLETCIYAAFNIDDVFSFLPGFLSSQLNDRYDVRCRSILEETDNVGCLTSDWYNFNAVDDMCVFSYSCANYDYADVFTALVPNATGDANETSTFGPLFDALHQVRQTESPFFLGE